MNYYEFALISSHK